MRRVIFVVNLAYRATIFHIQGGYRRSKRNKKMIKPKMFKCDLMTYNYKYLCIIKADLGEPETKEKNQTKEVHNRVHTYAAFQED